MNWLDAVFWWTGVCVCAFAGVFVAVWCLGWGIRYCVQILTERVRLTADWFTIARELKKQGKLRTI